MSGEISEAAGTNDELFVAVLAQIERRPEEWDQQFWCGSARCFAGWTCTLSGYERLTGSHIGGPS